MGKRLAKVDKEYCVGCGVCANVCPKNAISIFKGIYASIDKSKCIGCGICAKNCPGTIITLMEVNE